MGPASTTSCPFSTVHRMAPGPSPVDIHSCPVTSTQSRLTAALADRYRIERVHQLPVGGQPACGGWGQALTSWWSIGTSARATIP